MTGQQGLTVLGTACLGASHSAPAHINDQEIRAEPVNAIRQASREPSVRAEPTIVRRHG